MFHLLLYQPGLQVNFLFLAKKSYAAYVRWSEIPMFAGAFSARVDTQMVRKIAQIDEFVSNGD